MREVALIALTALTTFTACGAGGPAPEAAAAPPAEVVIAPPPPAAAPLAATSAAPATEDKRAAAVAQELATLDVAMLGALGGAPSPAGVLDSNSTAGVNAGVGTLQLGGSGGGVVRPGSGGGLAALGTSGATMAPGNAPAPKGPIGTAQIAPPTVNGGIANAGAVIAGMAAGFRRCYNKGLQEDPTMRGSVVVSATIDANGAVTATAITGVKGISNRVTACVAARVSAAQLAPPEKGSGSLVIPITFVAQ